MEDTVFLTSVSGPYARSLVEEILRSAGIPHVVHQGSPLSIILGAVDTGGLLGEYKFDVPSEHLLRAKEVLCANGVVCEVSERLLRRSLDEIVRPLLASPERDLARLARFIEVNNKETARALCEGTLREEGGRELLEDLFFSLASQGSPAVRILARALRDGAHAGFNDRFQSAAALGEKAARLALLGVLPELRPSPARLKALAAGLRDRDGEIREAASEALFGLGGGDYGYDPDDPPGEREAAVQRLLDGARQSH